jgi:hypothetical protein
MPVLIMGSRKVKGALALAGVFEPWISFQAGIVFSG